MELRKIQVTGGTTHVVSLPKKWVDRNGLGRSDALAIHEEPDGSLLVIPHSDARPRRHTIVIELPEPCKAEDAVRRLVGAYLAGADEIHVNGLLDAGIRKTIRGVARDLVGVEILDESRDRLVLQDLVGVSEMDLRKTVTRMHRIARIMFDDAISALQARDTSLARDVTARDDELDRLEWMVSKQMHALLEQPRMAARLDIRPAEALNHFLVARTVERMGDHASKICRNVVLVEGHEVPAPVLGAIREQADLVRGVWDEAFNALKRTDFERASHAVDEGKAMAAWRAEFPRMLVDMDEAAIQAFTLIADSVDRTRGYAIDIAEIAMNHTMQTK